MDLTMGAAMVGSTVAIHRPVLSALGPIGSYFYQYPAVTAVTITAAATHSGIDAKTATRAMFCGLVIGSIGTLATNATCEFGHYGIALDTGHEIWKLSFSMYNLARAQATSIFDVATSISDVQQTLPGPDTSCCVVNAFALATDVEWVKDVNAVNTQRTFSSKLPASLMGRIVHHTSFAFGSTTPQRAVHVNSEGQEKKKKSSQFPVRESNT
jgi:hypothetical protein